MIQATEFYSEKTEFTISEYEEYRKEYEKTLARSLDEYRERGHEWCWGLVGNIKQEREYGEEHEIRKGTKRFSGGAKVYIAPVQWGDGGENVVVIGVPRYSKGNIEIVTRSKYIENYRMKRVYKPEVINLMCASKHHWWNDTDHDRTEIIKYLEYLNPDEAKKEHEKMNSEGLLSRETC